MRTKEGDEQDNVPAYLRLAREFEQQIREGNLPLGSQLPAQRELALARNVHVSTVTRAYRELQKLDLVTGSTRRGTIVTGNGTMPRADRGGSGAALIDLTVNRPASDAFLRQLEAEMPRLAADPRFAEVQEYQLPEGPLWAREAGQNWIALNGFRPPLSDIVLTSGAQHALLAVICGHINPGDTIVADRLTYYGLRALAQMFRFRIIGIGSDHEGLSAQELRQLCASQSIKALFVVPTMQNPLVVSMSAQRRQDIVEIAREYDLLIIEDDVYGPLQDNRPPAFWQLAGERSYHISTLSKALAPGLRIGWLSCPPGRAVIMGEAIRTTAWMPAPLTALVAARWIEDGTAATILRAQQAEVHARHQLITRELRGFDLVSDPRCMFLWLRLPAPWRAQEFAETLYAQGVSVMPADAFACDRQPVEHAVRINFGGASSREALLQASRIIAATLVDRPRSLAGRI
ncbi:PLP-dependent aminotransferase family protein [Pseudogemmobacter faecipullorum]|uniref:PLP-dependent aminotransferase family protein n=1 Tax=Pseudogemmobacter faecipullorum TaxID=2755041 RepID=A0ABS8CML7_9RHOB|nr:PLP-dependent aminotransferase family protein [Pseudogemmobacter faecipullorum]MCB5410413.1 PLP-dependent aminotransferase family protein [Pseudogemmobacter faecipullorum]